MREVVSRRDWQGCVAFSLYFKDFAPHPRGPAPRPFPPPSIASVPSPPQRAKLPPMDLQLTPFDDPTETRTFEKGRFDVYRVGPMTLGRATYEPGWKWSEHVGHGRRASRSCQVEHVGLVAERAARRC